MSIWDIVQQVQIENLKARQLQSGSNAESDTSRARARDAELDDRIGRLVLVTEAMWELLSVRFGLTVADLAEQIRAIDARDGSVDGRRGIPEVAPRVRCASCQAVVPVGKPTCQFCGAAVPGASPDPFRV
jgi:hypothetical protein